MKSTEIRESFLKFFEGKQHLRWPSASIVPLDDPTLLLMTAGMAPFKSYFSGAAIPPSRRMTTCQKCVRADDVDRVGKTSRHHTFFEMLGNFSFGDYYKRDTIIWAWEYLTQEMKLDKSKLSITIHTDDDEAFNIWNKEAGIPKEIIYRLPDNFWGPVGDAGACGPCSEICYDLGPEYGCGKPDCKPGCDCDRYLEVWNLVFTGLNKTGDGKFENLPAQCIDTGLGLERLTMVMQGKKTPFHTDLFDGIIKQTEKISGKKLDEDKNNDLAIKVIADHIRAAVFMISDGITPSNQGRGYVLRRFLRRAVTFGQTHLGIRDIFLYKLIDSVVETNKGIYKELVEKKPLITNLIQQEEEAFRKTLSNGLEIIEKEIECLKQENKCVIFGDIIFKLYDTYGFPPELTLEIAQEHNFEADMDGYKKQLETQRERGRQDLDGKLKEKTSQGVRVEKVFQQQFLGASQFKTESVVEGFNKYEGNEVDLFINPTPFYAESGGQVNDTGIIESPNFTPLDSKHLTGFKAEIHKVIKHESGVFIHKGKLVSGNIDKAGVKVSAEINKERRLSIMRNHTATHLLHAALRETLGAHVSQTGSFVNDDGLRFDFTHGKALDSEEINKVEDIVNEKILENMKIDKEVMNLDAALKTGATALFQEKYDKKVNVVKVENFSYELCGGTHVDYTGQIGVFKILKEASVGTGIRRIEAVTGKPALTYFRDMSKEIEAIRHTLDIKEKNIADKVIHIYKDLLKLEKEIEKLKSKQSLEAIDECGEQIEKIGDISVIRKIIKDISVENLRTASDTLKSRLKSGIIILAAEINAKASILVSVTPDLTAKGYHAGNIVGKLAEVVGGKGGGRPDFAQAGGKDAGKLQEALDKVGEIIMDKGIRG